MIVYDGVKSDFLDSVEQGTIANKIRYNIFEKMGRYTLENEFRAWENSMQYMYMIMNDKEIPINSGVAIEYNIPQTAKRVDFRGFWHMCGRGARVLGADLLFYRDIAVA